MRIDAHHHVWDLAVRDQAWTAEFPLLRRSFTLDELHPSLVANDISATVIVQTVSVAEETPELLALAAAAEVPSLVVGWVDLTGPDVSDRLAELRSAPGGNRLVGIRHQVQEETDLNWLRRDDVRLGLAAIGSAGLAYDLIIKPQHLGVAADTVAALPDVRFILDHAGKPAIGKGERQPWQSNIADLARHPNVAVKLSGLVTEAGPYWEIDDLRPYAEDLLESFGPERIMFGSDWPVCLLAASYDQVAHCAEELTAHLSSSERAMIFGATAAQWYGLDEQLGAS